MQKYVLYTKYAYKENLQEYTNKFQQIKYAHIVLWTNSIWKGCKNEKMSFLKFHSKMMIMLAPLYKGEARYNVSNVQRTKAKENEMDFGIVISVYEPPYRHTP